VRLIVPLLSVLLFAGIARAEDKPVEASPVPTVPAIEAPKAAEALPVPTAPAVEAPKAAETPVPATSAPEVKPDAGNEAASLDDLLKEHASSVATEWQGPGPSFGPDHPWIEHHGYLRVRVDGIFRGHLGTQYVKPDQTTVHTSGYLPPLTENGANTSSVNKDKVGPRGEDWIGGANMRFRYAPTIHVADSLSIHAEFDILDNLVLGSTPDYDPSRPDAPLSIFATSQAPPSSGINGLRDSVSVKQAWLRWDIMNSSHLGAPLLSLTAGRMARHWGLGILENGGEDLDADYGTYVDRVNLLARLAGIYFEVGYGWAASGYSSESPRTAFGEPHDLTDSDDVTEITFGIFSKPMTESERKARFDETLVRNRPVLDWGLYTVFRRQNLDVDPTSWAAYQAGTLDPSITNGGYDQLGLVRRNAWLLTPDAWLRFEWIPGARKRLRLEIEAAASIGHVGRVQSDDPASGMDVRAFGAAFESEYMTGGLSFGLNSGFAGGDDSEYFGYLDKTNFANPTVHNPRLAAFYFNPDYRVDNLLFRYVIGTVTNAVYLKPFVQYDLFDSEKDALAGRFELLYARAVEKRATPGDSPNLGVETTIKLFYEEKNLFYAGVEWSVLWPLGAFNLIPSFEDVGVSKTSRWATSIRARIGLMF